jgi:rSAM/selenodomain-associated transferase 2
MNPHGDPESKLAVVIPTLDEEAQIGACLAAVGGCADVEVVISDGGSTDRTLELARRAGVRVVEGARGRGPQLNRGAAATQAPRLLFLHADCRLPEGWLGAVESALQDTAVALVCFRLRTEPVSPSSAGGLGRWWLRVFDLRSHGFGLPYGDQGFAVRREVFDRVGGFPDIPLMEDLVFARVCRRIGRIKHLSLELRTTARRVESKPLRAGLMYTVLPTLFRLGVAPSTLARWYGNIR